MMMCCRVLEAARKRVDEFLIDLCKKPPHRCRSVVHCLVCLNNIVLGSLDRIGRTDMLSLLVLLIIVVSNAEDLTVGDHLHVSLQFLHQDVLSERLTEC